MMYAVLGWGGGSARAHTLGRTLRMRSSGGCVSRAFQAFPAVLPP